MIELQVFSTGEFLMNRYSRLSTIDALRGLAALSVCWYHFSNCQGLLQEGWLQSSGSYGWLGVECFFVISGFVIPLSMYRGEFKLQRDWKTFFGKRILRLDPPYLISVAIAGTLLYLGSMAPGFAGEAPDISLIRIIGHIGYLNVFLGHGWFNPVYWTLAIEFQYYILIALLYVLISSRDARVLWISTLGLAALSFLPIGSEFVLHFIVVFTVGITTFQHHIGLIKQRTYFIFLLILSTISLLCFDVSIAIVGALTSLSIAFVRVEMPRLLSFFGMISYPMYLIHVPIGGRVVNIGKRFAHTLPTHILVFVFALALTVVSAYFMYLYVERPAQSWSTSLKYKSKTNSATKPLNVNTPV